MSATFTYANPTLVRYKHILSTGQWNMLIKTVFIVAFGWFLAQRLTSQEDIKTMWHAFVTQMHGGAGWMIWIVVILMPLNWLLEVVKWRLLMRTTAVLSWRRAIAGVLSGITFSLFTPNRIGEYGGRILYVLPKHRWQAVIASITGSFAQNLVHISFGLLAAILLFGLTLDLPPTTYTGLWVFTLCVMCLIWIFYLRSPWIARLLEHRRPPRFLRQAWTAFGHLAETTQTQLALALVFAFFRYLIFSFQYILLLQYFNIDVPWLWMAGGVAVIYLLQTSIPLPPFVDLIARNELGILLWAGFGVNELSIVAAGFSLWIINLAFPALCGLLTIATVNVLRSLGYENEKIPTSAAQPAGGAMDRPAL